MKKTLHNVRIVPNGHSGTTRVQKKTWAKHKDV